MEEEVQQVPEPVMSIPPDIHLEQPVTPSEQTEQKPKKPYVEKPLKVMKGTSYKEVSQRGGQKWFIGEPESIAIERREARKAAEEGRLLEESGEEQQEGEEGAPLTPGQIQYAMAPLLDADDALLPKVYDEPNVPAVFVPAEPPKVIDESPKAPTLFPEQKTNIGDDARVPAQQGGSNGATSVGSGEEIALKEGDILQL
ncbi:MAG TPA: hypothetical protein VLA04_04525 [Verrucomicrobiae bacterium]|nr:hypothetical protein [Verrucomicrobiae bacterium]